MKQVRANLKGLLGLGLITAWVSCKAPQKVTDSDMRTLPTTIGHAGKGDSLSASVLRRTIFYQSSHLNALIDTVLAHNYDLKMATERIRLASAIVNQSRGLLYPQVNGQLIPSIRRFGLYTMDGAGNIVTEMQPGKLVPINLPDVYIGAQASWEADLWGKLRSRKKASLSRFYAGTEAKQLVATALVAETAMAYYELLAYDQELRLLDETIRLQQEALDMVRIQKETAVTNELAVQQFEVQLLDQQSLRLEIEQLITDTESRINLLAGRYQQWIPRDSSFFTEYSLPNLQSGISAAQLFNRPDIRQAEYELGAADADIDAARAAFFPSLLMAGGVGLQGYRLDLLFRLPESIAYSLIGGLSAPLINRNQIKGEYEKSASLRQEALWNYRKTVTQAFLETNAELKRVENLQKIFDMKKREAEIISRSVSVSSELFRYGRANYVEVLLARQHSLRVNIELINTRKNQFLAAIRLYRVLGGGRE